MLFWLNICQYLSPSSPYPCQQLSCPHSTLTHTFQNLKKRLEECLRKPSERVGQGNAYVAESFFTLPCIHVLCHITP